MMIRGRYQVLEVRAIFILPWKDEVDVTCYSRSTTQEVDPPGLTRAMPTIGECVEWNGFLRFRARRAHFPRR